LKIVHSGRSGNEMHSKLKVLAHLVNGIATLVGDDVPAAVSLLFMIHYRFVAVIST